MNYVSAWFANATEPKASLASTSSLPFHPTFPAAAHVFGQLLPIFKLFAQLQASYAAWSLCPNNFMQLLKTPDASKHIVKLSKVFADLPTIAASMWVCLDAADRTVEAGMIPTYLLTYLPTYLLTQPQLTHPLRNARMRI